MIPRLKPYLDHKELAAIFSDNRNAVKDFEEKLAAKFKAKYGVAFLYGRSGLYALLKCLGIKDSEVIVPAYTCMVVPNAVAYSGNIPRFVDITLDNYNMDFSLLEKTINDKTKVIVATSLFGYPYDVDRLKDIIKRSGRDILLIQDCAHSFDAEYKNELLCNMGDAALFAFSITKPITSLYGGMITTNSEEIYEKLKKYRRDNFTEPHLLENLKMLGLFLTAYVAFFDPFYGFVNFLERRTAVLDPIVKYYREDAIDMPKDYLSKLPDLNARIGSIQLDKYDKIKSRSVGIAKFYHNALRDLEGMTSVPLIEGSTYLYCVSMVDRRQEFVEYMRKKGIQIGTYIEYAVPYMKAYEKYSDKNYPNAYACSRNIINLPSYPSLSDADLARIAEYVVRYFKPRNAGGRLRRSNGPL